MSTWNVAQLTNGNHLQVAALEAALQTTKVAVDDCDILSRDAELAATGTLLDILDDRRSALLWWVGSIVLALHLLLVVERLGGQESRHDAARVLHEAVSND